MKTGNHFDLTDREIATLEWISKGKTQKEIAELMFLTENGIRQRSVQIYQKIGAANAAGAIGICFRHGILKIENKEEIK